MGAHEARWRECCITALLAPQAHQIERRNNGNHRKAGPPDEAAPQPFAQVSFVVGPK